MRTNSYTKFAQFYDTLTDNVDYELMAERIDEIAKQYGKKDGILLELGCGTGTLCEKMSGRGYDVIGVDNSQEMLSVALDKKYDSELDVQYICQDMTELDMFGTIDVTMSVLDSLNHLDGIESVRKTFERVSLFAYPDGLFIFDMNTVYKHKEVLSCNSFVYDKDDVYCVWSNDFSQEDNSVFIALDFFEKIGEHYERFTESFSEIAYDIDTIKSELENAGFEVKGVFDGYGQEPVCETTQRVVFVAQKNN